MNSYYENTVNGYCKENVCTQQTTSTIRSNNISEIIDTAYYQRKRTKAKINVYIRKPN